MVHGITSSSLPPLILNTSISEAIRKAINHVLVVYGYHDVMLLADEALRMGIDSVKICYVDLLAHLLRNPVRRQTAMEKGGYPLNYAVKELLGIRMEETSFWRE